MEWREARRMPLVLCERRGRRRRRARRESGEELGGGVWSGASSERRISSERSRNDGAKPERREETELISSERSRSDSRVADLEARSGFLYRRDRRSTLP